MFYYAEKQWGLMKEKTLSNQADVSNYVIFFTFAANLDLKFM